MTMNRRLTVAVLVAAILAISSAAGPQPASSWRDQCGGSVSYGTLTISDFQNYDRYIATLPVFAVSGRYEVLPNVNLLVDYVFGSRAWTRMMSTRTTKGPTASTTTCTDISRWPGP